MVSPIYASQQPLFRGGGSPPPVLSLYEEALVVAEAATDSALYRPSDLSTLWQNVAGTVPVVSAGDPVGRMDDLSGNGNHIYQSVSGARPTYETDGTLHWLQPDGVDDWMVTNPLMDLGESWAHTGGWRRVSNARRAFAMSNSIRSSLRDSGDDWAWYASDLSLEVVCEGDSTSDNTLTLEQTGTDSLSGRFNASQGNTIQPFDDSGDAQGLAMFTRRNSVATSVFEGRFYGGVFITGGYSSSSDRELVERWVDDEAGTSIDFDSYVAIDYVATGYIE